MKKRNIGIKESARRNCRVADSVKSMLSRMYEINVSLKTTSMQRESFLILVFNEGNF